jgi:predicted nuclease of predicted toxin-antitoxin system
MPKLFADENIAPRVVQALKNNQFDIVTVYEENLVSALDEQILKIAQKQNRIILTHDKDFGNLIRQSYQQHGGVILLRLRDQSPGNVILHLIPFLKQIPANKIKNRLVIFREGQTRIT